MIAVPMIQYPTLSFSFSSLEILALERQAWGSALGASRLGRRLPGSGERGRAEPDPVSVRWRGDSHETPDVSKVPHPPPRRMGANQMT